MAQPAARASSFSMFPDSRRTSAVLCGTLTQQVADVACRYSATQLGAAAVAFAGLAALLFLDGPSSSPAVTGGGGESGGGSAVTAGNALALLGASGYAASNVLTEAVLARSPTRELLWGLGGAGAVWSAACIAAFERAALRAVQWSWPAAGLLALYSAALFAFYCGVPAVIRRSGSAVRTSFCVARTLVPGL